MERHTFGVGDDDVSVCGPCLFVKDKDTKNDRVVLHGAPLCGRPVNLAVHWPDACITGEMKVKK